LPGRYFSERKIERQRDACSVVVIRKECPTAVGCVDEGSGAVGKRSVLTHLHRRADRASRRVDHLNRIVENCSGPVATLSGARPRSGDEQGTVILRESFSHPQTARDILTREIKWFDSDGANAFHVPVMKELVRNRTECCLAALRRFNGQSRVRYRCAVPMFHSVAGSPWYVVQEKGVVRRFVFWELAED